MCFIPIVSIGKWRLRSSPFFTCQAKSHMACFKEYPCFFAGVWGQGCWETWFSFPSPPRLHSEEPSALSGMAPRQLCAKDLLSTV